MRKYADIILKLEERAKVLDSLNQSVQTFVEPSTNLSFDANTRNNIMAESMASINNLRIMEKQLLDRTSSYWVAINGPSRRIYNPTVNSDGYIAKAPTPQFGSLSELQMHYTAKLAALTAELTIEHTETNFVFENETTANTIVTKDAGGSPIYSQAEADILASIIVMQASLAGDNPDSAVS